MNITLVRNTLVLVTLMTISTGYFAMLGHEVPPKVAIAINVVLVPILIGAIGNFALKASVGWKALMLLAVPLVNRLYLGTDPAYDWLSNLVTLVSMASVAAGVGAAHFISGARRQSRTQQETSRTRIG